MGIDIANYRFVYISFWRDYKVLELFTPDEKLLFLYLLTNCNTTQIGVYKILIKEISFMTGFTEETVSIMMDRFENEYNIIKYNKKTREICIVNWAKYNLNKLGGKPIYDCIKSELKHVEDVSLLGIILSYITKEEIRKLFIEAINERKRENDEFRKLSKGEFTYKSKKEDDELYGKPSEEQLKRAREL